MKTVPYILDIYNKCQVKIFNLILILYNYQNFNVKLIINMLKIDRLVMF